MATFYADNYKKAYVDKPSSKIPPGEVSGEVKFAYDEITLGQDAIASGDVIMTSLRVTKGAKILDAGILIPESLGTKGKFALGRLSDDDSLVAEADAGGQAALAKADAASVDLLKDIAEDEVMFVLKCTEETDAANGKKIKVWLQWCDV
jgi:hypothetical protein